MGSFGERMQREREMRGIKLEEIAEHTRISSRNLRALETERFDQLPGGIFNKGFVRAYARYLGIDADQAVADMLAAEAAAHEKSGMRTVTVADSDIDAPLDPKLVAALKAAAERKPRPAQRDQGAGLIRVAITLVVLLGIGGFAYKFVESGQWVDHHADAVPRAAQPATAQSPAATVASTARTTASQVAKPSAPTKAVPRSSAGREEAAATSQYLDLPLTDEMRADHQRLNLQIRTREESWVQVKADGKLLMEGLLMASSSKNFAAENELVVKLGNAAAVELSYNGKDLPAFDPELRTRTLTFTPDGVRQ